MRVDGQEGWYPLVTWGTHWYEADGQWEVLLEDASDIEILVESLVDEEVQVEKVSLEGLPKRTDYSLRLQVEAMFLDERTCKLTFRDVGFGEFFTPTDFRVEKTIQLEESMGSLILCHSKRAKRPYEISWCICEFIQLKNYVIICVIICI